MLTQADLEPIVQEAIARWTDAGLSGAALSKMTNAQFTIANLSGAHLGETVGEQVYIDAKAAGYGWFVDSTPSQDEEFTASNGQLKAVDARAVDQIDLLTVVEHELGHVAGLEDLGPTSSDLMDGTLGVGARRDVSSQDAIDALFRS